MKTIIKIISVFVFTFVLIIAFTTFTNADNNYNDFQYVVDNGEIVITGYTGTEKNIIVPYAIDGIPVRKIAEKAFFNLEIESIILSNNVKYIEELAFAGNQKLTSVTLSTNLVSIGEYAFTGCYALPSIIIPNSVTEIGRFVFLIVII